MKRDPEKFDDPAFSNFSIEDTFHDIENKFDINRIKKFQIVRKHYVAFGLITDLDDITEDDLTTLKQKLVVLLQQHLTDYISKSINILKSLIVKEH